ncbi:hypothetical protein HK100_011272 [Physocladia obscura]|uniref:histone acetyltransferase n=1 Tax=Physocladia obscura TaxID=109957 RepID=A0AAD5XH33_9FUNG|nr:hypothetical protein HK100_011272 [Physocladia obscura]
MVSFSHCLVASFGAPSAAEGAEKGKGKEKNKEKDKVTDKESALSDRAALLISSEDCSNNENNEKHCVVTHALLVRTTVAFSPVSGTTLHVFVDKADSSGFQIREVQQDEHHNKQRNIRKSVSPLVSLLAASITSAASLFTFDEILVHVFARSQPEYLFPQSAKNTRKHILPPRNLIQWWAATLIRVIPPSQTITHHAFLPNAKSISSLVALCGPDFSPGFGYPAETTRAIDVIPARFSDCSLAKALGLLADSPSASLSDFMNTLEFTGECNSGVPSAFFTVRICSPPQFISSLKSASNYFGAGTGTGEFCVLANATDINHDSRVQFQRVLDLLMSLDFSCLESAQTSSAVLIKEMVAVAESNNNIKYSRSELADRYNENDCSSGKVINSDSFVQHVPEIAVPVVVNNLQSIVKKKRPAQAPPLSKVSSSLPTLAMTDPSPSSTGAFFVFAKNNDTGTNYDNNVSTLKKRKT